VLTPVYSFILTYVGSLVTCIRVSPIFGADAYAGLGYDMHEGAGAAAGA
jgi:hypothetical protein